MIEFREMPVTSPDAAMLLNGLNGVLTEIIGNNGCARVDFSDFGKEKSFFIVGCDGGIPVCCAGIRRVGAAAGEIKRVYARKNVGGWGSKLTAELEKRASDKGYLRLVPECRTRNPRAIEFYKKCGYSVCGSYPPYIGVEDAVCLDKYPAAPQ